MSRPPHAREAVLDAFEAILLDESERAATLEAVARRADVSKGGLLYHFGSKEELESGLIERLGALADDDVQRLTSGAEGAVAEYLRASVSSGSPLDRAILAVSRLANGGHAGASDALRQVRERWADAIRAHARDDAALDLILLVGDGLYWNVVLDGGGMPGPAPKGDELDALIRLVEQAAGA